MGRMKQVKKSRQVPKTRQVPGADGGLISEIYYVTEEYTTTEYVSGSESYDGGSSSYDSGSYSGGGE